MTESMFQKPEAGGATARRDALLAATKEAIQSENPSDWRMAISCLMAAQTDKAREDRLFGMMQAVYLTMNHPQWWAFMAQRMAPFVSETGRGDGVDLIVEHFAVNGITITVCDDCGEERVDPNVRCECKEES